MNFDDAQIAKRRDGKVEAKGNASTAEGGVGYATEKVICPLVAGAMFPRILRLPCKWRESNHAEWSVSSRRHMANTRRSNERVGVPRRFVCSAAVEHCMLSFAITGLKAQ